MEGATASIGQASSAIHAGALSLPESLKYLGARIDQQVCLETRASSEVLWEALLRVLFRPGGSCGPLSNSADRVYPHFLEVQVVRYYRVTDRLADSVAKAWRTKALPGKPVV